MALIGNISNKKYVVFRGFVLVSLVATLLLSMESVRNITLWNSYIVHPPQNRPFTSKSNYSSAMLWNNLEVRFMQHPHESSSSQKLQNNESPTMKINYSSRMLWVDPQGGIIERISAYNEAVNELRKYILQRKVSHSEWKPLSSKINVVLGADDDFLKQLEKFDQVQTISLSWSKAARIDTAWSSVDDNTNLLVQKYYAWICTEPLYTWIHKHGFTNQRFDIIFNHTCETNQSKAFEPKSLDKLSINVKPVLKVFHYKLPGNGQNYPPAFYKTLPLVLLQLQVISNGVIDNNGNILSGNLKLIPFTCEMETKPDAPMGFTNSPIYDEVFIIKQFWGAEFFHKNVEVFPRIAPYIEFLKRNQDIPINVPDKSERTIAMMTVLGMSESRLITGVIRAKIIYVPRGTQCGMANIPTTQLLSKYYRDYIHQSLPQIGKTKNLVLIKRSGSRHFTQHAQIEVSLRKLAQDKGLQFVHFLDNPTPTFNDSMVIFNNAIMVVAPHGAGLSNIVFSEPGTWVIEGVCNPPHVNMCFQRLAYVLGHHYHAVPSRSGCGSYINIDSKTIVDIAEFYLSTIKL